MDEYKYSTCLQVTHVTPAHITFTLFSNMILTEYEHVQATRASMGSCRLREDEFLPFVRRLRPHIIRDATTEAEVPPLFMHLPKEYVYDDRYYCWVYVEFKFPLDSEVMLDLDVALGDKLQAKCGDSATVIGYVLHTKHYKIRLAKGRTITVPESFLSQVQ